MNQMSYESGQLSVCYLTDVLGHLPAVGQLGCVLRTDVVALLQVEGLLVLQLRNNRKHRHR